MSVTDSPRPSSLHCRPSRHQALLPLPAQLAHVSAARHFAADLLETWSVPETQRDSAVLIVDELAASAAQYGRERMTRCSSSTTALCTLRSVTPEWPWITLAPTSPRTNTAAAPESSSTSHSPPRSTRRAAAAKSVPA
jgi:Histidine kinase-like ATPase domain